MTLIVQDIGRVHLRTDDGNLTVTPSGPLPDTVDLTTIPGVRTSTQRFHPLSEGASLCDYVAYVMTLPDLTLPARLSDIEKFLRDQTAAHYRRPSNLYSAMDRDPRFTRQNARWTFSDAAWAAMETVQGSDA